MTSFRSRIKLVLFTLLLLAVSVPTAIAQNVLEQIPEKQGRVLDPSFGRPEKTSIRQKSILDVLAPEVASNYAFGTTVTGSLEDMSSGTTTLLAANIDDTASPLTGIGFDFFFQGVRYSQFSINDNGVLRLGGTAQGGGPYKPLGQAATAIITAYGADQRTHVSGKVHFKVIGSAPNRTLVIEWLNNQANFNLGGTADVTYQVRLSETTGVIEFVYGSMTMSATGAGSADSQNPNIGFSSNSTAGTIGTVTAAQSGTPVPSFDGGTATPVNNLYTAGAITVLSSASNGTRRTFSFTPPAPNGAPTSSPVSGITQTQLTLNWVDTSSNELGFAVYRSLDNVTFNYIGQAAADATSYNDTGLLLGTNYFYRVFAVTEGVLSTAASFTTATLAAGSDSCAGAGGLWSVPGSWSDGSVPTTTDNVSIGAGCVMTIDTAAVANALSVDSGGILDYGDPVARSLTVSSDVIIGATGTFRSGAAQTGHVLSIGGNLTNNGILDFSTNAGGGGAGIVFTGTTNTSFNFGATSTTDFKQTVGLTVNKGVGQAAVLSFNPNGTITVLGANAVGFLTITNGTFKMDGTGTFSNPLFNVAAYSVPAAGALWMNNPNATVVGLNGSPSVTGRFQMTAGTYNVGTGTGNSMGFAAGSNILVEGGAINTTGRFGVATTTNSITYSQTGGTVTVQTVGNASTTLAGFDLGTGTGSTSITGGTIVIQLASTGASGPRDFRNQSGLTGTTTVTGGTVQFGNASSGAAKSYSAAGVFPNVVVDNTSAGHTLTLLAPAVFNNVTRNVTINTGATFNIGNNVFLFNGSNLTNNGTLTANGASSNFVWFNAATPILYQGSGIAIAPITNFAVQADAGLTMDPGMANVVVGAVRLFSGSVINSNKITLGNGGVTTGVVQIGNTTTPTAAGSFDVPFTFNLGTGGQNISYLRTTLTRTTGPEVNPTRTLNLLNYDDNDITHSLTITGGDLTMTSIGTTTSSALQLTNGVINTGTNKLILSNGASNTVRTTGYVNGYLQKAYAAAASKTFEVGHNGYTPVVINATAGTFPSSMVARALDATLAGFSPSQSLSRNWQLEEVGDLTVDLTFNYLDPADVNGVEADYRVYRREGSGLFTNLCPGAPCVDTTLNTGTVTGITQFSRWTMAELITPTAAVAGVGGRVLTADGRPIRNVMMVISGGGLAAPRYIVTGSMGYYSFEGLPVGEDYVVSVSSKRFSFADPVRVISLQENLSGEDFIANQIE